MYGELQSEEWLVMNRFVGLTDEELKVEYNDLIKKRWEAMGEIERLESVSSYYEREIKNALFEMTVRAEVERRLNPVRRCMFCEKLDCSEGCRT